MAYDVDLKVRTKKFALRIIKLYQSLPKETDELIAIFVSSINKSKRNNSKKG